MHIFIGLLFAVSTLLFGFSEACAYAQDQAKGNDGRFRLDSGDIRNVKLELKGSVPKHLSKTLTVQVGKTDGGMHALLPVLVLEELKLDPAPRPGGKPTRITLTLRDAFQDDDLSRLLKNAMNDHCGGKENEKWVFAFPLNNEVTATLWAQKPNGKEFVPLLVHRFEIGAGKPQPVKGYWTDPTGNDLSGPLAEMLLHTDVESMKMSISGRFMGQFENDSLQAMLTISQRAIMDLKSEFDKVTKNREKAILVYYGDHLDQRFNLRQWLSRNIEIEIRRNLGNKGNEDLIGKIVDGILSQASRDTEGLAKKDDTNATFVFGNNLKGTATMGTWKEIESELTRELERKEKEVKGSKDGKKEVGESLSHLIIHNGGVSSDKLRKELDTTLERNVEKELSWKDLEKIRNSIRGDVPFVALTANQLQKMETAAIAISKITVSDFTKGTKNLEQTIHFQSYVQEGFLPPAFWAVRDEHGRFKTLNTLISDLKSPVARERSTAADFLHAIGPWGYPAFPNLVEALGDESPDVVGNATDALVANQKNGAHGNVVSGLDHPNPQVRRVCHWILGMYSLPLSKPVVAMLEKSLKDSDAGIRCAAAFALARKRTSGNAELVCLLEMLKHDDRTYRKMAIDGLEAAGNRSEIGENENEVLGALFRYDRTEFIGPWSKRKVHPAMIDALWSGGYAAKYRASIMLKDGAEKSIPLLIGGLEHRESKVRRYCVDSLDGMREKLKESPPMMKSLLRDQNEEVRICAARFLAKDRKTASNEQDVEQVLSVLIPATKVTGTQQREAIYCMGCLGASARSALPKIRELMRDNRYTGYLLTLSVALARIDPSAAKEAADAVVNVQNDPKGPRFPNVEIARTLGEIGPGAKHLMPVLVDMLKKARVFEDTEEICKAVARIDPSAAPITPDPLLPKSTRNPDLQGVRISDGETGPRLGSAYGVPRVRAPLFVGPVPLATKKVAE